MRDSSGPGGVKRVVARTRAGAAIQPVHALRCGQTGVKSAPASEALHGGLRRRKTPPKLPIEADQAEAWGGAKYKVRAERAWRAEPALRNAGGPCGGNCPG